MVKDSFVVISPGRNESKFMRSTLDSVISQSRRPALWIIVNDGSTDNSADILLEYTSKHTWIKSVNLEDRGHRSVGPGVIEAFYAGLEQVAIDQYQYICKLDLDLILPKRYFEELITRCNAQPRVGNCSGKAYMKLSNDQLVSEGISDEMSVGASKFIRVDCYKDIGGFVRQVMWDGIDCHTARMKGWIVVSWDHPDLNFTHLRPMGSSDKNILKGRFRHGFGQHFMGGSLLYSMIAAVYRIPMRPFLIGGLVSFWGHFYSKLKGEKQYGNAELRSYVKKFQLRCLTMGKKKATLLTEKEGLARWNQKKTSW